MKLKLILYIYLLCSFSSAIEVGQFILKSGHIIKGSPLFINFDNNVGEILIDNELQKIPTRLFTKKGLESFKYLSLLNKGYIIDKNEGDKGYEFQKLTSFFALNQEKSKASKPIFVYVNPNQEEATKILTFIQKNPKFSSVVSYFDKRVFIPKKKEQFQLIKQVMKTEFPAGIVLHKNKANDIYSNLNSLEDILNIFKKLKSKDQTETTTSN
ncbi:MAG: hypothetical protein COB02_17260 [Candidatus Cloacimonadota bacterium]|nr:MAG: hypothetical protein COB02_17260 [Candidatus Cloacimonadota bacterium]